jgi:hypothetical protein
MNAGQSYKKTSFYDDCWQKLKQYCRESLFSAGLNKWFYPKNPLTLLAVNQRIYEEFFLEISAAACHSGIGFFDCYPDFLPTRPAGQSIATGRYPELAGYGAKQF